MTTFTNKALLVEGMKNALHLIKTTTQNEQEFEDTFRQLLPVLKQEYQAIKTQPYTTTNQSELAKAQYEIVQSILDELDIKVSTPKKKTKVQPTNPKWDEEIIVVPRKVLFNNEELTFQGSEQNQEVVDTIMNNVAENFTVMRRGNAEDKSPKSKNAEINTNFKQPIPYVLIKRGDEIFVYERLSQGGESRLHNKLSLGVGGHINPVDDANFNDTLSINLQRELDEELTINSTESNLKYIGLINDDEDEVGKVHLGILAINELSPNAVVEVKEVDQLKGEWMSIEQLISAEVYERLENWSKIAVDIL